MSQSCDGRADIFSAVRLKARKVHRCAACELSIRKGDTYVKESSLYESHWSNTKRCERCDLIFEHLVTMCRAHGDSDEWPDPQLDCGHEYRERWDVDPPAWLAALAFWLPGDPLPSTAPCTVLHRYHPEVCRVGWFLSPFNHGERCGGSRQNSLARNPCS